MKGKNQKNKFLINPIFLLSLFLIFNFSLLITRSPSASAASVADPGNVIHFSLRIIPVSACNDSVDNDGDGKIDYPDDPGCEYSEDNNEIDPSVWLLLSNTTVQPATMVKIFGQSSPGSLNALLKDGFSITANTTDADGDFQFTIMNSVDNSNHAFAISSQDVNNQDAKAYVIPIDITSGKVTQTYSIEPKKIDAQEIPEKILINNAPIAPLDNQPRALQIIIQALQFVVLPVLVVSVAVWGWGKIK